MCNPLLKLQMETFRWVQGMWHHHQLGATYSGQYSIGDSWDKEETNHEKNNSGQNQHLTDTLKGSPFACNAFTHGHSEMISNYSAPLQ